MFALLIVRPFLQHEIYTCTKLSLNIEGNISYGSFLYGSHKAVAS